MHAFDQRTWYFFLFLFCFLLIYCPFYFVASAGLLAIWWTKEIKTERHSVVHILQNEQQWNKTKPKITEHRESMNMFTSLSICLRPETKSLKTIHSHRVCVCVLCAFVMNVAVCWVSTLFMHWGNAVFCLSFI